MGRFGNNATEKRRLTKDTWPGPVEMRNWKTVGKSKYEKNSLKDFAQLNLTGVNPAQFGVSPTHDFLHDQISGSTKKDTFV